MNTILSDDLLTRFAERAPQYDAENRFFDEDFADLREAGYLLVAVPKNLGGGGCSLAEVCELQRRLSYHAPATAVGVHMHIYWTGVAADLWYRGDKSLEWLLRAAVDGEVFAAGHAESGNDIPVLFSTTTAKPVEGGYRLNGQKSFGSLSPVWTYMGLHAVDDSDPSSPKIVHAFLPRETEGCRVEEDWDVLGMRATQSHNTILEDVFVPDAMIARVVPMGGAGIDEFVLGVFAWALLGFGNVYYGLAQRAFDMTVDRLKQRGAVALTRSYAYHPEYQHQIAKMAIELEGIGPHLEKTAHDWSQGADYGATWPAKIFATKHRAVTGAWQVVDTAFELAGGYGIFRRAGLERLLRDARLGRIHPSNPMLTHEVVAKTALGISLDEQPRWG